MSVTQELVHRLLDYDPADGVFTWKPKPGSARYDRAWNKRFAGKVAGRSKPNANGYLELAIDGVLYYSHRLAWLYMTGEWPEDQIDHINLNKSDNRFENLREANAAKNGWNVGKRKRNTSGYKNVVPYNNSGLFLASFVANKKRVVVGLFETAEEAHKAYVEAAKLQLGEFARAA